MPTWLCRSSSIPQMEYVTIEEVFDAYYSCRQKKRRKESALRYEMDYELENYRLYEELNAMTYKPGTSIAFCVTMPKLREVFAADFRDRIVHHLLVNRFNPFIEARLTDNAFACRKDKGNLYGARKMSAMMEEMKDGWYVKCDIQGFFMSIDKDILFGMLRDVIIESGCENVDWWLWLAETVVKHRPELDCELHGWTHLWRWLPNDKTLFRTNGKGLPIGNLTSQVLANLYMAGFDRWAMDRLGKDGRFGRYVDDFVIMHRDRKVLLQILSEARNYLRDKLGLKLHPRKTVIQKVCRGMLFTGYFLKGGQIMPGHRMRRNALSVAAWWNEKKEHNEKTRRKLMVKMNSYYGMLLHPSAYKVRRKMWFLLQDKKGLVNISMKRINLTRI